MPADDPNSQTKTAENSGDRISWQEYMDRAIHRLAENEEEAQNWDEIQRPNPQFRVERNPERLTSEEREIINHNPGRSAVNQTGWLTKMDKIKISTSLSDRLGLTPYQRSEVLRIMVGLNLDRFGNQKRIEKVALTVIRHVVDRDRVKTPEDFENRIANDSQFRAMLEEQEMDLGDLMRLSAKVNDAIKELGD